MLLVPTEAVIQTGTRSVVMVAEGDGKFAPVDVEVGVEADGRSEIRKGLEPGQKVVVSGQFLLDSEASLRSSATRMTEVPEAGTPGPVHKGEGKVESIADDEVMLSHGPIPSLQWGPMTMGFRLPRSRLPEEVRVGDTIMFEFRQGKDGMYEITNISPMPAASKKDMKSDATGRPK